MNEGNKWTAKLNGQKEVSTAARIAQRSLSSVFLPYGCVVFLSAAYATTRNTMVIATRMTMLAHSGSTSKLNCDITSRPEAGHEEKITDEIGWRHRDDNDKEHRQGK